MSLIAGNLGAVQRLLDDSALPWGICAGAAAHLYGVRRPIENVDILLPPGHLRDVRDLLRKSNRSAQYDGRILLWRGIKIFDNLPVIIGDQRYPFLMDELMQEHLCRLALLGSRVLVIAPEDAIVQKALLTLGNEAYGKHHRQDLEAILRVQKDSLDLDYLAQRIDLCQARQVTQALLSKAGLRLPL